VTHEQVTAPTGQASIYGKVHFKNLALGVVVLDAAGNTWLVGQQRYTLEQYSWELPEGGGSSDESPLVAAQRELREETGISAKRWTPLLTMHTSNSVTDELAHTFVAQELSFGHMSPDDTEQLSILKLPLSEAVARVMEGEITDSLTVASLLKVQRWIDTGVLALVPL